MKIKNPDWAARGKSILDKADECEKLAAMLDGNNQRVGVVLGLTRCRVMQLRKLAKAPERVRALVLAGQVSATSALHALDDHGYRAADHLEARVRAAKATGKARIASRRAAPVGMPGRVQQEVVAALQELSKATAEAGESLELYENTFRRFHGIANRLTTGATP